MRRTTGFTIIELVAVIVILGILAAVALPKYLDLSASARSASCNAWKGTIEGGGAINYAARVANAASGAALITCTNAALSNVVAGGLPNCGTAPCTSISGTFSSGAVTNGNTGLCTVAYNAGGAKCSTTVTLIGIN